MRHVFRHFLCTSQLASSTCKNIELFFGGWIHFLASHRQHVSVHWRCTSYSKCSYRYVLCWRCVCRDGFDGPRCQRTKHSFSGNGWAWFEPLTKCEDSHTSLELMTTEDDGLILYQGPLTEPEEGEQGSTSYCTINYLLISSRRVCLRVVGSWLSSASRDLITLRSLLCAL